MKEILTVYNENLEEIGVESREEVHKRGLKHKVVHCFIVEKVKDKTWLYFQQRSYNKADFPGLYDIACAGHIDAGEEPECSMIRELQEEVGININKEQLNYVGRKFETLDKGKFLDNEICEIYVLKINENITFKLGEEVEDLVKVPLSKYIQWVNRKFEELIAISIRNGKEAKLNDKNICPHVREYNEILLEKILDK